MSRLIWRLLFVLIVIGGSVAIAATNPVNLGLDLEGGTQIVLEAQDTELEEVDGDTLDRTLEVMRRRVDQLGVAEPNIQASGDRRIIIELPGVSDPDEALEVIGRTAQLTFHKVLGLGGGGDRQEQEGGDEDEELVLPDEDGNEIRLDDAAMSGDAVGEAEAVPDPNTLSDWSVSIGFRGEGGDTWAEITGEAACEPQGSPRRRIAIVLDERVISSPSVDPEVECDVGIPAGGQTSITGTFTEEQAKDLALLVRAGALPVPVEVIEQRTIGPTLGDAAIEASTKAAIIGAALTIIYVVAYYRILGVLAALALFAYGVISYAALAAIGATLTLPGIAGFVLAIGMAVDANVLVFERSKEEFAKGKRLKAAVLAGFKKAWTAILDSNATTVLAAIILFYFAAGAVRGFGITLTVGVIVSMFCALVITRLFTEMTLVSKRLLTRPKWFGMNIGGRLRTRFEERPPNIVTHANWWFALSLVTLVILGSGLVARGLNFGLDFTGGRLLEYSTQEPADLDEVRENLAAAGFPRIVVQESGDGNVAIRAGELSEAETDEVQAAVEEVTGPTEVVREEFVGPTIGDELRRKAFFALALGLGAQLIYLAIRFRWTYGASAVVALAHDIIILLGIFAWLQKDVDGVFIAALLTVIGYSINDSVVVFDRIREDRTLRPKDPLALVANDACLQTVPRTINTGLGALFILVALYVLGGETLTDFALVLIVGILVGTYSSVFTAAPLIVLFERLSGGDVEPERRPAARPPKEKEPEEDTASVGAAPAEARPRSSPPSRPRAGAAKRKRRRR